MMFRPTWTSSGSTQYIKNTWKDGNDMKFYKND